MRWNKPVNADAARLCQAFETGGDVHSIAKDVAVLDDDVAHIDANPEFDATVGWQRGIALGHCRLHLGRAT